MSQLFGRVPILVGLVEKNCVLLEQCIFRTRKNTNSIQKLIIILLKKIFFIPNAY